MAAGAAAVVLWRTDQIAHFLAAEISAAVGASEEIPGLNRFDAFFFVAGGSLDVVLRQTLIDLRGQFQPETGVALGAFDGVQQFVHYGVFDGLDVHIVLQQAAADADFIGIGA